MKAGRQRLPNRRTNETVDAIHDGRAYAVTLGFDPATGEVREIFANGAKTGSDMAGSPRASSAGWPACSCGSER